MAFCQIYNIKVSEWGVKSQIWHFEITILKMGKPKGQKPEPPIQKLQPRNQEPYFRNGHFRSARTPWTDEQS